MLLEKRLKLHDGGDNYIFRNNVWRERTYTNNKQKRGVNLAILSKMRTFAS